MSSTSEIDHLHLLSEQLGALVPGEEYSDVTFVVEEKRFPAHRVILAARCQYFRLLFMRYCLSIGAFLEVKLFIIEKESILYHSEAGLFYETHAFSSLVNLN